MRRVVITGAGVISAIGDEPEAFHQGLCAGSNYFRPIEHLELHGLDGACGIGIPGFDPKTYLGDQNFRPLDRTGRFSVVAASLALENAGWTPDKIREREVGLFLGTLFCGLDTIMQFDRSSSTKGPKYAKPMDFANTVINAAAGQTALWHDLRGVNSTVAAGSVSGLNALIQAAETIRMGHSDALLAGGSEGMSFESLFTFFQTGMLSGDFGCKPVPFHGQRAGFAHGEGAAFLMLEELESAQARGAEVLVEIRGAGTGFDPSRGSDGQRAANAVSTTVRKALREGELEPEHIDAICVSANGSVMHDEAEANALQHVFAAEMPAVTAPKSVLGECFGAGGAFQTLAMLETFVRRELPGVCDFDDTAGLLPEGCVVSESRPIDVSHALVNSVGYDGICATMILSDVRGQV